MYWERRIKIPVYQKLINMDQLFAHLSEPPVIINDLNSATDIEKEKIKNIITTRYTSDMLSILPSCECGHVKGEFAVGVRCERCNTVVRSVLEENIEPILWFRAPEGVHTLINPKVWTMLKNRFKKSGFNIIQWLCDTTYRANVKQPKIIDTLCAMGVTRGYNYFCDNFDTMMEILFNLKDFKIKRRADQYIEDELKELIKHSRDTIFSKYLPLPNKSLLVIEKTNVGIYIDETIIGAIDAIEMIVNIDSELSEHTVRTKENRTVKAIAKLSEFYESFDKNFLSGKTGLFRKNMLGGRTHFAFRAVVTSLTGDHKYDEIEIPWGIGVTAFRPHLLNKLMRRGYSHNQAVGYLHGHVERYSPLIDQLFKELFEESDSKNASCIMQRN